MKSRADFTYHISDNVLVIEDKNLGRMSVTNDIENVIDDIIAEQLTLGLCGFVLGRAPQVVIYRDSDGQYDGVRWDLFRLGVNVFYSLSSRDETEAVEKATVIWRRLQSYTDQKRSENE